jgi:alkylated DNA repair dioxygenase AlkB
MPDAEVFYLSAASLPLPDGELKAQLIAETPWRQEEIVLWGKRHLQPRLVAWYGDEGCTYTYSGIRFTPLSWTDLLMEVKESVEAACEARFNSVLLNYYRDHRDSMGFHSDDEPELGRNPVIASLSLGEEREFIFKHKKRKDIAPVRLPLASGSVLLMKGETQHHWKHGVEKSRQPCGDRVNLTFRTVVRMGRVGDA